MWRAVARRAAREAFARSDAVAAREIDAARAAASTLTRFRCVCGCASPAGAACERRSSSTSREDSSAFSTTTTTRRAFRPTPRAFRSREEWARGGEQAALREHAERQAAQDRAALLESSGLDELEPVAVPG